MGSTTRRPRGCRSCRTGSGTGPCWHSSSTGSRARPPTSGRRHSLAQPAAVAKCNTLAEWLDHEQARVDELVVETEDPVLGRVPLVGPAVRIGAGSGAARPGRRHGAEQGALGGHRIIDLSNFWAGPLAARLLAELGRRRREGGAAGRRGRVPADAGAAEHLRGREPVEAGPRPRPQDRRGPGPAARPRRRVRRRRRERHGGRVGAPGSRRGAVACRQPGAGVRPGQGLRRDGAAGVPARASTTSSRRRRGWR